MAKRNFIQTAIKNPGALMAKAKAAGMTVPEFCQQKHDGTTARQCNLASTLRGLSKKR